MCRIKETSTEPVKESTPDNAKKDEEGGEEDDDDDVDIDNI